MSIRRVSKLRVGKHNVEQVVLRQARREGNIIFGGQAIKRSIGVNARRTKDFDMFTNTPKKSANKLQMKLDRQFQGDDFFSKKGRNPGTWKVKHKGLDGVARTDDDIGIADFTKTPRPVPNTFTSRENKFRVLREEAAAKIRLLKNPTFKFRQKKDFEDLIRIKRFGRKVFR